MYPAIETSLTANVVRFEGGTRVCRVVHVGIHVGQAGRRPHFSCEAKALREQATLEVCESTQPSIQALPSVRFALAQHSRNKLRCS